MTQKFVWPSNCFIIGLGHTVQYTIQGDALNCALFLMGGANHFGGLCSACLINREPGRVRELNYCGRVAAPDYDGGGIVIDDGEKPRAPETPIFLELNVFSKTWEHSTPHSCAASIHRPAADGVSRELLLVAATLNRAVASILNKTN
jgi:hypothetical protein